jgi:hypothetical protein
VGGQNSDKETYSWYSKYIGMYFVNLLYSSSQKIKVTVHSDYNSMNVVHWMCHSRALALAFLFKFNSHSKFLEILFCTNSMQLGCLRCECQTPTWPSQAKKMRKLDIIVLISARALCAAFLIISNHASH